MQKIVQFCGRAARLVPSCALLKRETAARLIFFLVAMLAATTALGDIEVKPQYDANEQITVKVTPTSVPAGAMLRGSFQVSGATWDAVTVPNAVELRASAAALRAIAPQLPPEPPDIVAAVMTAAVEIEKAISTEVFHVWAGSGTHTISASGIWVLTDTGDLGGKLVDFGMYNYTRTFTVGEVPQPDPTPDPVPPPVPGQRWAIVWIESATQTPEQGNLLLKLRQAHPKSDLLILDPTRPPPSLQSLASQLPPGPEPVLMVLAAPLKLVRIVPLPSSVAEVDKEIVR